jgi:hypothetical protein
MRLGPPVTKTADRILDEITRGCDRFQRVPTPAEYKAGDR